jgi:uncharacterized protein
MDMTGEYRIPASREVVWEALNDPEILKASIPGCEDLQQEGDHAFAAKVRAKVGPVNARFSGKVNIIDPDPPNGYRIEGEGTGGAAGFAKGGATVHLAEDGADTTVLTYEASASVGGKLAQIGSRLIDGTARKMADEFFAKFSQIVSERSSASASNGSTVGAAAAAGASSTIDTAAASPAAPAPSAVRPPPAASTESAAQSAPAAEVPGQDPEPVQPTPAAPAPPPSSHPAQQRESFIEEAEDAVRHTAEEVVDVADSATKGVPQWMWIAAAAVIIIGLLILLT